MIFALILCSVRKTVNNGAKREKASKSCHIRMKMHENMTKLEHFLQLVS